MDFPTFQYALNNTVAGSLLKIGLFTLLAPLFWVLPRRARIPLLLIASLVGVYVFQPRLTLPGTEFLFPAGMILLTVNTWWILQAPFKPLFCPLWLLVGGVSALTAALWRPAPIQLLGCVLVLVGVSGVNTLLLASERSEVAARRLRATLALFWIGIILMVLIIAKSNSAGAFAALQIRRWLSLPLDDASRLDLAWVGFSYIAFRLMHVLLDYRNGKPLPADFTAFGTYVLFFASFTAGPIDRVEHFSKALEVTQAPFRLGYWVEGALRILIGLFKRLALESLFSRIAINANFIANGLSGSAVWLALYAYAFQLFFDFSAYTDIAIGIGLLFGIRLPENFANPYLSPNLQQFWQRWHITLSTWLRYYIFMPLSRRLMQTGLRQQRWLVILSAQVVTMVLIGFWHGIQWNYLLWGLWHGLGLWGSKQLSDRLEPIQSWIAERSRLAAVQRGLNVLITFHFVAVGWLFFALPTPQLVGHALLRLIGK